MIVARDMPQQRRDLVRAHDTAHRTYLGGDDGEYAWLAHATRVLSIAELYYVAAPMVDLAVAAADTVPDDALETPDLLPAEAGMLVWGAPLPAATTDRGERVSPRGMWWLRRGLGVDITWLVDADDHPDRLVGPWAGLDLFPSSGTKIRNALVDDQYGGGQVARTAVATWLLMGQPILAHRETLDVRATSGAARRRKEATGVTVVDLRALYRPSIPREDDTDEQRRRLRYRHIVRGHWRQQAVGRDRAERRTTWIASHEKGPEGAPLVVTEKVMVWRR